MHDDCSRRVFLKKFALLSAGSLMLGATAMACYGPGPIENRLPTVSGMFFIDSAANWAPLQNSQNVPVDAKFEIKFSVQMNTALDATVEFTDQSNATVLFDKAWDNDYTVSVIPSENLLFDTGYRLRVLDAESQQGEQLILDANADSIFKTVVA